jgi:hypothetical protein
MGQTIRFVAASRQRLDWIWIERLERASDSGEIDVGRTPRMTPESIWCAHGCGRSTRHRHGLGECAVGYSSPLHQNLQDQTVVASMSRILRPLPLRIVFMCNHEIYLKDPHDESAAVPLSNFPHHSFAWVRNAAESPNPEG